MTLSQLKRDIKEKKPFVINRHRVPDSVGQKRIPNIVQTNGCYTQVLGEPDHKVSLANNGNGYWLDFGKAKNWEFYNASDGIQHCVLYDGYKQM